MKKDTPERVTFWSTKDRTARAKVAAKEDGRTLSAWLRRMIDKALTVSLSKI